MEGVQRNANTVLDAIMFAPVFATQMRADTQIHAWNRVQNIAKLACTDVNFYAMTNVVNVKSLLRR